MCRLQPITLRSNLFRDMADCVRIVAVLATKGYAATIEQALIIWEAKSADWDAGWLIPPDDDDELFEMIEDYFHATDSP